MSWEQERVLLSPAQEREFWLAKLLEYPHGMAINCRHMPSLTRTPVLRKLIEDGKILRVRENRGRGVNRTVIYLPEQLHKEEV